MAHEIVECDESGIVQARISGVMTPADQQAFEQMAKRLIDAGGKVRVLVTLDGFTGWEQGPDWGDDLAFQFEYGNDIARIAVVGDPRWKDQALMYLGKGFRETAIEYFPPEALPVAKAWVHGA